MDNPTLFNFVQTYCRAYQVCQEVIDARWNQDLVDLSDLAAVMVINPDAIYSFTRPSQEAVWLEDIVDLNIPAEMYTLDVRNGQVTVDHIYNQPGTPWIFDNLLEVKNIVGNTNHRRRVL